MLRRRPTPTLFPYTTLFRSNRVADEAGGVRRVELLQDPGPVGLDGLGADPEELRDLLRRLALGDELQHLAFPRRQRIGGQRSEEHTSELQSHSDLVCRLLLE